MGTAAAATSFEVGARLPELRWTLTANRVARFSAACGMASSEGTVHDDEGRARAAGFDEPIGYGLMVAGLLTRAVTDAAGAGSLERLRLRFVAAPLIGDTLVTEAVVVAVRTAGGEPRWDLSCRVGSDAGDERLVAEVTVRGGPPPFAPPAATAPSAPSVGSVVVVERGPVANFAGALDDANPLYVDARAAAAAGHPAMPVPPLFGIGVTLEYWGRWPELQPDGSAPDPMYDVADELERIAGPGPVVHAMQELDYRRPLYVGDRLVGTSEVSEPWSRDGRSGHLTFLAHDSRWWDRRTGDLVLSARMVTVAPRAT